MENQNNNFQPVVPESLQGQMPAPVLPSQDAPSKGGGMLLWIILAIIIIVGALAFWLIGRYYSDMDVLPANQQAQINKEARQDALISNELETVDLGNMDSDLQQIDADLNSL